MPDAQATAENMKNHLADAAERAREKASETARTAGNGLDRGRSFAAGALDAAARTIGSSEAGPAQNVAGALRDAADYVRSNEFHDMKNDVVRVIRHNPVPSVIAAAALGFLIGNALRRD